MKKTLIALVLVLTFGLSVQPADAFTSKYASFWEQFFGRYGAKISQQKKSITSTYNTTKTTPISKLANRRFNSSRLFNRRNFGNRNSDNASLFATISSTGTNQEIYKVTDNPINVFKLGIRNNTKTSSSKLPVTAFLDTAEFQLFSKNGIFNDPSDFVLVVNDEESRFSDNGKVTLKFNNARLAESENLELNIAIKADDPSNMAHINGTAKLQLLNITAYKEFSRENVPVKINGSRISKQITYNPVSVVTGGGDSTIVSTAGSSIYGDIIVAGEEKFVLAARFNSRYDDLAIRKMTIRNNFGNAIDSQIEEVQAINLLTGELLGTSRFTNGEARFQFSPRVIIARNNSGKIGFKVKARENPRNNGERRFKLGLFANDVVVESLSNGRELPNSNKNFNVDSYDFLVLESKLVVSPTTQPSSFSIGIGSPENIYNFQISNDSRNSAELGRVSFEVYPNGLQFAGGSISTDDFELVELYGNREKSVNASVSVSGNKVSFDFTNPESIYSNSARKFRLKAALEESGGSSNNDGVSVRIASDGSYQNGTFSGVQGSGANFIWSDESASPHSVNSSDWFSGYRLDIPSNSVYVKR